MDVCNFRLWIVGMVEYWQEEELWGTVAEHMAN